MPALMRKTNPNIHAGVVSTIKELYGEDTSEMKVIPFPAEEVLKTVREHLTEKGIPNTSSNILAYAYIENYGGGAIVKLK